MAGLEPALDGTYRATLKDGTEVEVVPAFVLLRRRLDAYAPEDASNICGVHPDTIRQLARKVANKRTRIITGWTNAKSYHGDLMERAMCLVIALTGNWGGKGSGIRGVGAGMFDGAFLQVNEATSGSAGHRRDVSCRGGENPDGPGRRIPRSPEKFSWHRAPPREA